MRRFLLLTMVSILMVCGSGWVNEACAQFQEFLGSPGNKSVTAVKEEGRFTFRFRDKPVVDEIGLMESFDLYVQLWTLLGEAIEYYDIGWESSGEFEVDNRRISRSDLAEYPDLLKRFDNLRPSTLSIELYGTADGGTMRERRGHVPDTRGLFSSHSGNKKIGGQAYDLYTLYADVIYVIEDRKLLYTRSGRMGSGIIGGSPHWNEFLHWSRPRNMGHAGYAAGDRDDEELEKLNKRRFGATNSLSLMARVNELKWPMHELRYIIEKYDKYESGEEEPSPEELVKAAQEEVEKLKPTEGSGFWNELPAEGLTTETYSEANSKGEERFGLRDTQTGKRITPPEFVSLEEIRSESESMTGVWAGKTRESDKYGNTIELLNSAGKSILGSPIERFSWRNGELQTSRIVDIGPCFEKKQESKRSSNYKGLQYQFPGNDGPFREVTTELRRYTSDFSLIAKERTVNTRDVMFAKILSISSLACD